MLMQVRDLLLRGVRLQRHLDADVVESCVATRAQTQEGVQVKVAGNIDGQLLDLNPPRRRIGGVAHGKAVAERREHLLDRVGGGVRAAEGRGLIGGNRREGAHLGLAAEAAEPGDARAPTGGCLGRVIAHGLDESADGLDVDIVEKGGAGVSSHGDAFLGMRMGVRACRT